MSDIRSPHAPPGDVAASFRWARAAFALSWAPWVVVGTLLLVVGACAYVLGYLPLLRSWTHGHVNALGQYRPGPDPRPSDLLDVLKTIPLSMGLTFVLAAALAPVTSSVVRVGLLLADGHAVTARDFLRFPRGLAASWGLGLLLALGTSLGLLLCYAPGLIFSVLTCFSFHVFHDQGLRPVAAIKASATLVRANPGITIVAVMVAAIIGIAGVLACVIGTVVATPLAQLFLVHRYRTISGRGVATLPGHAQDGSA